MLATRDELLREQIAEPASGLDRPQTRRERGRPLEQLSELTRACTDTQLAQLSLSSIDRRRGVQRLVRVDPNDHGHDGSPFNSDEEPWWALLVEDHPARLFRATPRSCALAGQHLARKPTRRRQAVHEPTRRTHRRYERTVASASILNQAVRSGEFSVRDRANHRSARHASDRLASRTRCCSCFTSAAVAPRVSAAVAFRRPIGRSGPTVLSLAV